MAVDSVSKRGSAMNVGCPWRPVLPRPDGVIGYRDKQQTAYLYSGIVAYGRAEDHLRGDLTVSAWFSGVLRIHTSS